MDGYCNRIPCNLDVLIRCELNGRAAFFEMKAAPLWQSNCNRLVSKSAHSFGPMAISVVNVTPTQHTPSPWNLTSPAPSHEFQTSPSFPDTHTSSGWKIVLPIIHRQGRTRYLVPFSIHLISFEVHRGRSGLLYANLRDDVYDHLVH